MFANGLKMYDFAKVIWLPALIIQRINENNNQEAAK